MREIKFRAWDGKKMQFVAEGRDFAWLGENAIGNMPVMQYTGLKDKNGKEIWEGDIVKIHNYKQTWKHQEPPTDWRIFKIVWNRYLWSFNNEYISKPLADYDTNDLMPYEIEIIGNIYENPNLLD